VVGGTDGKRRRGHGGKAVGVCDEGTEGGWRNLPLRSENENTSGSSTGRNTRCPNTWNGSRAEGLGTKRSLALREFALGLEALERFVHKEPLRRVHECVFWRPSFGE
jgi:hypothetical protein